MRIDIQQPNRYDSGMNSLNGPILKAIEQAEKKGITLYRIAADSGMDYACLHRFYNGKRDLRLETAAVLCDALNLELRPKRRKRG